MVLIAMRPPQQSGFKVAVRHKPAVYVQLGRRVSDLIRTTTWVIDVSQLNTVGAIRDNRAITIVGDKAHLYLTKAISQS